MAPKRVAQSAKLHAPVRKPSNGDIPFRQAICVLCLLLADLLAIAVSLRLAIFIRAAYLPLVDRRISHATLPFGHYLEFAWVWLPLVVFLGVEGLYTQRRTVWNEIAHLTKAVALGLTTVFAAIALVQRSAMVSRLTVAMTAVILLFILPVVRYWTKRLMGVAGIWRKRILILGSTSTAKLAMCGLVSDPILGYEITGVLDEDQTLYGKCVAICGEKPVYVLGGLSDALRQMELTGAKDILIAMPELDEDRLLSIVHSLQQKCESIYLVPQLWCLPLMNLRVDGFLRERLMMLKLSNNLAKPWNIWFKRGFDLIFGFLIACLALPLCLFLALVVRLDSAGPAFFVQERLGYRGVPFRCIKFRTMHIEGDEMLVRHLEQNPDAADEWQRYAKLRGHDPRLTQFGTFLRKTSLDELPQLWNVLRGQMSLVGPRPYMLQERARLGEELVTILSARPGMTGFWQVSGRNELTLDDRVQLEAWYIRNWTVWFDCIILAKTFRTVFFPWGRSESAIEAFPDLNARLVDLPSAFARTHRDSARSAAAGSPLGD